MIEKTSSHRFEILHDDLMESVSAGRYSGPVFSYTLQEGDTLSLLAHRYGTTVRVLRELNGIDRPEMLFTGATLMIPQR